MTGMRRMYSTFVFLVLLFAADGCTKTRYGCCPDGRTPSTHPEDVGCPTNPVQTSSACASFIKRLPLDCTTTTNCRKLRCYVRILTSSVQIDLAFHRCSRPVSVNATVSIPSEQYAWSHLFAKATKVQIANLLAASSNFDAFAVVNVAADKEGKITASMTLRLLVSRPFMFPDIVVIPDNNTYIPVDTSDCSAVEPPQNCAGTGTLSEHIQDLKCQGGKCVWAAVGGGAVCYVCSQSCSGETTVCGDNGVTYNSDCDLRKDACAHSVELKIASTGPCDGSDVSTPPPRVDHLPDDLSGLSQESLSFFRDYVIYVQIQTLSRQFTSAYLETQFRSILEYDVVVLDVKIYGHNSVIIGGLNVTIYATYLHSDAKLLVKADDLITKVKISSEAIRQQLGFTVINSAKLNVPEPSSDNTTIIVIAVVCSVCGVIIIALLVIFGLYFGKKRRGAVSSSQSDVAYLPQNDDVAIQQKSM